MSEPKSNPDAAPAEVTRDARLVAIETRQKLRDEHVDRRFDAMTTEFSSLDKRVSSQIAGLDHKIEMGFRMLSEELKTDRNNAESRVSKMYEDWRVEKDNEAQRPASIKLSLLIGIAGVIFPTLSVAAVVIMLVVNPIAQKIDAHTTTGIHVDGERRMALLEERSVQDRKLTEQQFSRTEADSLRRHEAQQEELRRHETEIHKLLEQRVTDAERWGAVNARFEWLRDDVEALKEDLHQHEELKEHPSSDNRAEISRLQGMLLELNHVMGGSALKPKENASSPQ